MIPLADKLIGIAIGTVVCVIFAFIVFYLSKKANAKNDERVKSLTDEQRATLINAPVTQASSREGGAIVKGLLYEVTLRGQSKAKLVVLFYNTYFPNSLNQIQWADLSIPFMTLQDHQLKQGDYVNMQINANGAKLSF